MKLYTIVFTKNNARILRPGQDFDRSLPHKENTTVDHLKGTPPHFWVLDGDAIRKMTKEEQQLRENEHASSLPDNTVSPKAPKPKIRSNRLTAALLAISIASSIIVCLLLWHR